jgi:tRNA dimethylallyltransferase
MKMAPANLMSLTNTMSTKTLYVVIGPTAVGKTALSISLAKYLDTDVISADSRQFFKEMTIGTAVPSTEELQTTTHHFIQHRSIQEEYNVGLFEKDAIAKISELFQKKDSLIMTGGSGLYINAVCFGLNEFPTIDTEIRETIREKYHNKGLEWLQEQVLEKDPKYFEKADIHNHQRMLRCLEVCLQTGQAYSQFTKENTVKRDFDIQMIGIEMERKLLYDRINKRVDIMIKNGLVEEVKKLQDQKDKNALQTVGYKEVFGYLNGDHSLERAIELIKQNSRRYAKRQITWFKKYQDVKWVLTDAKAEDLF